MPLGSSHSCGLLLRREEAAHHLVGRPGDRGHGGDAEALVDERPARVVDAGDHAVDGEVLTGDAGGEDVRVVAARDRGDGIGPLDPGFDQVVAVEPEAHDLLPTEATVGQALAERVGVLVDHGHRVAIALEAQGELTAHPPASDDDDVHRVSLPRRDRGRLPRWGSEHAIGERWMTGEVRIGDGPPADGKLSPAGRSLGLGESATWHSSNVYSSAVRSRRPRWSTSASRRPSPWRCSRPTRSRPPRTRPRRSSSSSRWAARAWRSGSTR